MKLAGQARRSQHGYAMAALLVAMGILAIMMTVAMPVWKHAAQREKEEELVFRGTQYAHAIGLFSRKYANAFPPSLDVLVEQRFLRKKFKDPITGEDFQPILAGQGAPGISASPGAQTPGATAGRGAPAGRGTPVGAGGPASPPGTTGRGISPIGTPGAGGVGGVMGVTSKSKEKSIRLYNGRSHYNEWAFVFTPQVQQPGAVGAPGQPGQRGQPPGPPGQRGQTGPQRGNPGTFSPFPGRGNPTGPGGRGGAPPLFPPPGRGRSGG